ncbi:acetyltransferase [Dethiosulfatibacter aminovorans DSM 17477]|uniref:Acetyltransferase n=1 Tax=Dethiosulfatibacter aminovorans DSM 17477 TaxID=1121476 RepID=A0A1M6B253_9FIRM|nr:acetate--CoA ligase family protein [Dethiosulfatibacter aminovorans]SHI42819.1 acetyltransferase [Dethiosulfatibacter aminovorans DSM 17477]
MNINKLLKPKKIAIVGASDKEGFGGDTCRNAMAYMSDDKYYFINPRRDEVFGKKCYESIRDLPEKVDMVVICTPVHTVEAILREAHEKGAGAAVVFASGYSEVGTEEGVERERSLIETCRSLDMALMGPNCAGFINYSDMVSSFAFISEERDRKGRVGFVSQSGQLALSMMDSPKMKFSYAISSGNSSVVTMEDYLDFLVDDEDTKVIAMYLEGIKDTAPFVAALKKAALKKKPVVILKTGRSRKGQEIAASHTGSLSGTDKVYDALFRKFGVIRVDDLEELMSTCMALSVMKRMPENPKVASMNLSGGETGICADLGELHGIEYANFGKDTMKRLKEVLPSYASPNNPLDMTATLSYDVDKYAEAVDIVMMDQDVGLVAIGYTLLQEIADPAIKYMTESLEKVLEDPMAKPVVMIPFTENTRNAEYSERLEKIGVPVLPTSNYAFKVLKNITGFIAYDASCHNLEVSIPEARKGEATPLSESESKNIIGSYGIPFPRTEVVKSLKQAHSLADDMGYPLVAKIDSPDIMHKSDAGCVMLNLKHADEVVDAYSEIIDNAVAYKKNAVINGVQLSTMVKSGIEMIIGVKNDPQLGPCIMCGLGGVFVEVFKDTALGLAPVSRIEAENMVDSLKGVKLLNGYRGSEPADKDAFVDAIVNVSRLATEHMNSMSELDINPIFVYEEGICAVDALYVKNV